MCTTDSGPKHRDRSIEGEPTESGDAGIICKLEAQTRHPILNVLANRWSPRAYDPKARVDDRQLFSALEAARWAPSAFNQQPWRFAVAQRGTAMHREIHSALIGFNREWAGNAAVLIVAIAETIDAKGSPISHALYDLGQAVAHLSVQSHSEGLFVHQMSGFDADAIRRIIDLEPRFQPVTVVALGKLGQIESLTERLRQRESEPRTRRSLAETIVAYA